MDLPCDAGVVLWVGAVSELSSECKQLPQGVPVGRYGNFRRLNSNKEGKMSHHSIRCIDMKDECARFSCASVERTRLARMTHVGRKNEILENEMNDECATG